MKVIFVPTFLALLSESQALPTSESEMVSVLAITKSKQDKSDGCIYDYTLKNEFQNLPSPKWLASWNNVMANTLQKYDVKKDRNAEKQQQAEMLLFSMASGYAIDSWHPPALQKRFPGVNLQEMMDDFWENGEVQVDQSTISEADIDQQAGVQTYFKRAITETIDLNWIYDNRSNSARVSTMRGLESHMESKGEDFLTVTKKAICQHHDGSRACLSWTGGDIRILARAGRDAIASAVGGSQQNGWISAFCRRAFRA